MTVLNTANAVRMGGVAVGAVYAGPTKVWPQPWTPAQLPGLVAWYDASDTATITASAGKVSQWADKSGHGFHLTQATSTNQPSTGTNTQNGRNVVTLDGVNDALHATTTTPIASNAVTLYVVAYVANNPDFNSGLLRCGAGNVGNVVVGFGIIYSGNRAIFQCDYGGNLFSVTAVTGAAHQFTLKGGAPTLTIYKDGVVDATGPGGAAGGESGFHTAYAGWGAPGPLVWLAEAFYANVNHADADRTAAETYLKAKWGTP